MGSAGGSGSEGFFFFFLPFCLKIFNIEHYLQGNRDKKDTLILLI